MKHINRFLGYLIPFLFTELLFRYLSNNFNQPIFTIRSILFSALIASILFYLNSVYRNRIVKYLTIFILVLYPLYGLVQIGMLNYYGIMFSVRILMEGTPNVGSYAQDFITTLDPIMILFVLIPTVAIYVYLRSIKKQNTTKLLRFKLISSGIAIISFSLFVGSLFVLDPENILIKSSSLFSNPYLTEAAANQLGMGPLLVSDLQYLVFKDKGDIDDVIIDKPVDPPVIIEPNYYINRKFDDSEWNDVFNSETNDTLKQLDSYFLNKGINPTNDKTGKYKDKNFVYVLTEAFDMIAIDEKLTPTLYKLKSTGTYAENFYSPQFNCATAESELISMTSIYPVIGTCTMSAHYKKASSQTVFNLFKDAGYKTSSYHNWNDEFYPRTKIHPILGSEKYLDHKDLIPKNISGWQSDLTMMKGIVKDLNTSNDKFMAYVITSSTHLPYDTSTNLGRKYVDQVKKVYPNAPFEIQTYLSKAMELDKAMEYLLDNLDDIDNTVIMMFADHRPLRMPNKYLVEYSNVKRSGAYELERTPMIMYTPNQVPEVITKRSSTIDMLPTISNLFDLKHDTRLFMGVDLYGEEDPIVVFYNGSWYDQVGYFDAKSSKFTPYNDDITYTSDKIQSVNASVKQKLSISSRIYSSDYFNHRTFIRYRGIID